MSGNEEFLMRRTRLSKYSLLDDLTSSFGKDERDYRFVLFALRSSGKKLEPLGSGVDEVEEQNSTTMVHHSL
jgi:hypothetical protein